MDPSLHGVLVVDKPRGPTSHDIVARARRALRTKAVGHAGTLDPMATGALVLLIGEGTKLARYLTAEDKLYEAEITLGSETDSLDAEGVVVAEAPLPPELSVDRVAAVARRFVGRTLQKPPALSAIKLKGRSLHARVRRGEKVDPPEREVVVRSIDILDVGPSTVQLRVESGKGFYVRSLARDLALALETRGHLSALRRTRSGRFRVEEGIGDDLLEEAMSSESAAATLRERILPPLSACASLPRVELDPEGERRARHGQIVPLHCSSESADRLAEGSLLALASPRQTLVAIARRRGGGFQVERGFNE